jgi:hypothetical protein
VKPKVVIGSIKCKQSYSPDDKAFHSSDVPSSAKDARIAAKTWKRPPILGGVKPTWNADSTFESRLCTRASSQLLIPNHLQSRDSGEQTPRAAGWNTSTQLSLKEVDEVVPVFTFD